MSITFSIEAESTGQHEFACYANGIENRLVLGPFGSYDEALLAATAHKMKCIECDAYGCHVTPIFDVTDSFDVNMSNDNARSVMEILGLTEDRVWGSMPAREFLNLVSAAYSVQVAVGDNSAISTKVDLNPGGPTLIDCGRPEGYALARLEDLMALANEALKYEGRSITWG